MPGVTNGENWNARDPHLREFDAYSRAAMSPQRRLDSKSSSVSQYSNGYSTDHNSDLTEDKPTYLLEHLATFSVGAEYGLSTPKDGLRRLLHMEKSSGIWTQKMQMRLEKKWVVIIDNENGDIVERFPMNLISEPTSYTNNDTRELYNNILIFIVKDDPKNKNHNPSEMHIFQCARVSAQEVVNEMKMFMSGKWKPGHRDNGRHIPPPPSNPPPDPPVNGVNVREQVNLFNAVAAAAASPPRNADGMAQRIAAAGYSQRMDRLENRLDRNTGYSRDSNDETSSTSSDKYERDVAILNHCFDDIERFIARLQHAAAAFKELERRQKSRKNKKKDMGDGMLSMRAKPPSEREFIDILQKFKLSFNLLAKLKSHIHDPNAPELVHFLFTPLALIVDAAKDSNYSTTLPSRVVAPLLTRDAKELLMNCCTSKESDLWHSLGDSWIISRDQWKGYEGSYHPVFSNGWAPENPFSEERERPDVTTQPAATSHKYRREELSRAQDETEMRHPNYRVSSRQDRDSRFGSDFYYNERGERDRPSSPGLPSEIAHPPYDSRYYDSQNEVPRREREPYDRSEALTPVSDREFQDHRDRDMRSDFSADSIEHGNPMDPHRQFERQQRQWLEELKGKGAKAVQVMYPRTANNDKELTVVRGEFLEVLDDTRKWWKAKNIRGQVAHVPHTIVGPPNVEDDIFSNPLYGSRGAAPKDTYYTPSDSPNGRDRTDETGPREPAPQKTPALPTPAPADWVRRERQGKKGEFRYF